MERKIGEIFEFKKDWYQCVEGRCKDCHFSEKRFLCKQFITKDFCTHGIIFKKLEKVGEPFTVAGRLHQDYKVFDNDNVCGDGFWCVHNYKAKTLTIEIKLNKEDMEEKKIQHYDCFFDKEQSKPNLKPFSLELAKQGKPVCTRDGHRARIICFDYNGETGDYPIVALVHYNKGSKCYERVLKYTSDGLFNKYGDCQHNEDLMMLPEKKEGWVNVYPVDCMSQKRYSTKEEALSHATSDVIDTIKITWEE